MWNFLNANAGGIQAMASMVTAAVTVALVAVTWRYVHMTQRLADLARQDLMFQEEAEAEKWRELNAQTKLLGVVLATLPDDAKHADWLMRQATTWEPSDVARFQRLAARLDRKAGEQAAAVVAAMTWLSERLRDMKSSNGGLDRNFPWPRWSSQIAIARKGLDAIARTVSHNLSEIPATKQSAASRSTPEENGRDVDRVAS